MPKCEVGDILRIFNREVVPPHDKYSLCVRVKPNLFFLINSENRKMYNCIPISEKNYSFLKHDSHIACNRTFSYSLSDLKGSEIIGHLNISDLRVLYEHLIKNVKTISPNEKTQILESLENLLADYL